MSSPAGRRRGSHRVRRLRCASTETVAAEEVLLDKVVPPAGAADLHDVYLELTERHRHPRQLGEPAGLSGGLLQLVAIDVVHQGQVFLAADRTAVLGRLAVEFRRTFQIWRGIAHLVGADATGEDLTQQCPPSERVVDNLPLRTHADEGTRSRK